MRPFKFLPLEERIVLDGALAHDVAKQGAAEADVVASDQDQATGDSQGETSQSDGLDHFIASQADSTPDHLLVISSDTHDLSQFLETLSPGTKALVFDFNQTTLDQLQSEIDQSLEGATVSSIGFVTEGAPGAFALTSDHAVSLDTLASSPELQSFWVNIHDDISSEGRIDIFSCSVAATDVGKELISHLQEISGVSVAASTDLTGYSGAGGNWTLEVGNIDASKVYFDTNQLDSWQDTLATVSFSISDVTVAENNNAVFTVTKIGVTTLTTTVDYDTQDVTALAGAGNDYTAKSGTLSFTPGQVSKTITVRILNDNVYELTEQFNVVLSNATGDAIIADSVGVATINDNDAAPAFSVGNVSTNEGAGTMTFTVTKAGNTDVASSVDYATADGTATAGSDYISTSGSLNFAAGETSKTVTVNITDDSVFEGSETLFLNLSNPVNATIADSQGIGTVTENDTAPTFTIGDVSLSEGGDVMTFTVTKSGSTSLSSSVNYATANITASSGADYTATSGTLTFASGETSKTISVNVLNDAIYEGNETFAVNLTSPVNATIADTQGIGTIVENDSPPTFAISDVVVKEGNTATFTVTKTGSTTLTATVDYATADGSAIADSDYRDKTGTLTFTAGQTSKTITITILNDTLIETPETFFINLSNATNSSITDSQGTGTIIDADGTTRFYISDTTVDESAGTATFTVYKSGPAGASNVNYATADISATAGSDYSAASGTLNFASGELSKTVTVSVLNDSTYEHPETFAVNLSGATGGVTIADSQGIGTITDNDIAPTFGISDVSVSEADGTMTFTVTKTGSTAVSSTVDYATADGTALAGSDYTATSGTLTFAAGEASKTVTVNITNDSVFENNETLTLNLSNATDATITTAQATGTIVNDDSAPTFSVDDVSFNENAGTMTFTVTKTGATAFASSVNYATADGSATAGSDYAATSGTLNFAPGETSKTVTVTILDDSVYEGNETINLNLSAAGGATISDSQGVGTITDNEAAPTFSISDVAVNEADGIMTFTVTKSGATDVASSVNFSTADGTAIAGSDYVATSGTLTFAPNETSKTIAVSINNDNVYEHAESFTLNLSNATNATIADAQASGSITDNDAQPGMSVSDTTVSESGGSATFVITKTGPTEVTSVVHYSTQDGSATAGQDYVATSGSVTFGPNETSKTVSVAIINDNMVNADRSFTLNLTASEEATITKSSATATIINDDSTTAPRPPEPNATVAPAKTTSFAPMEEIAVAGPQVAAAVETTAPLPPAESITTAEALAPQFNINLGNFGALGGTTRIAATSPYGLAPIPQNALLQPAVAHTEAAGYLEQLSTAQTTTLLLATTLAPPIVIIPPLTITQPFLKVNAILQAAGNQVNPELLAGGAAVQISESQITNVYGEAANALKNSSDLF